MRQQAFEAALRNIAARAKRAFDDATAPGKTKFARLRDYMRALADIEAEAATVLAETDASRQEFVARRAPGTPVNNPPPEGGTDD